MLFESYRILHRGQAAEQFKAPALAYLGTSNVAGSHPTVGFRVFAFCHFCSLHTVLSPYQLCDSSGQTNFSLLFVQIKLREPQLFILAITDSYDRKTSHIYHRINIGA